MHFLPPLHLSRLYHHLENIPHQQLQQWKNEKKIMLLFEKAKKVLAALEQAEKNNKSVAVIDDKLIEPILIQHFAITHAFSVR